jgi:hypothetical protein
MVFMVKTNYRMAHVSFMAYGHVPHSRGSYRASQSKHVIQYVLTGLNPKIIRHIINSYTAIQESQWDVFWT